MLKRTSLNSINKKLKENPNWNILDIGCGYTGNQYAKTVADVQDLSNFYKDKKFVKITEKKLPFKENEFDFVISSHVIEHVDDLEFFIKELERITKQGYVELPTRLGDNIVFENSTMLECMPAVLGLKAGVLSCERTSLMFFRVTLEPVMLLEMTYLVKMTVVLSFP